MTDNSIFFADKQFFYTIFAFMKISPAKNIAMAEQKKDLFISRLGDCDLKTTVKAVEKTAFLVHKSTSEMDSNVLSQK